MNAHTLTTDRLTLRRPEPNDWDVCRDIFKIAPVNARSIALAERLGVVLDLRASQSDPYDLCLVYRHTEPATLRTTDGTGVSP